MEAKRQGKRSQDRDKKEHRDRQEESQSPPSQAVTKLALPEGGVSLESSQLGESQAALGIWGREGTLGEAEGASLPTEHQPLWPGSYVPPAPSGGP